MDALPAHPEFAGIPAFRGRPLHRGEFGSEDVKALQARLNDLGFGRLSLTATSARGRRTPSFTSRHETRSPDGKPLAIDGEVGESTWAALFGLAPFSALRRSIRMRRCETWSSILRHPKSASVEQPRGSNRGPEVDVYIRTTGLNPAAGQFSMVRLLPLLGVRAGRRGQAALKILCPRRPA